jgi:molybdate transport system regulatory protein
MRTETDAPQVGVILKLPNGGVLAPADLELIDAVRKERSIIGASRALGLSYRKCWLSVDALNRTFESPVVATFPGRREGGAEITPFGERVVSVYRSIERHAANSAKRTLDEIIGALDWSYQKTASDAETEPRRDRASGR